MCLKLSKKDDLLIQNKVISMICFPHNVQSQSNKAPTKQRGVIGRLTPSCLPPNSNKTVLCVRLPVLFCFSAFV